MERVVVKDRRQLAEHGRRARDPLVVDGAARVVLGGVVGRRHGDWVNAVSVRGFALSFSFACQ